MARATRALLRRFRSRRPVRGGSLLITIFGDAVAPRGGAITLGSLIALAAPFGLTERLVRTSVARLAHDGWLVGHRDGRRSEYRLTEHGQKSFAQATSRIYAPGPSDWDEQWTLLLLPTPSAPTRGSRGRDRLREQLRWLGFGQVGPSVFLHPGCTPEQAREWLRSLRVPEDVVLLRSQGGSPSADRRLVAAGWDLIELARRYRLFVEGFRPIQEALSGNALSEKAPSEATNAAPSVAALGPEAAFVVRTLLIHDYRKIHLQDPLLPLRLLPERWVGASAYQLCRDLYGEVLNGAEDYLTLTASTLQGPLPSAGQEVFRRFGGLGSTRTPT